MQYLNKNVKQFDRYKLNGKENLINKMIYVE